MFVSFVTLSLATSFFARSGAALDIDVKDQDSIKSVAKTLAGGIIAKYKNDVEETLVPGNFDEPYYWWEAGAVLGSLVDYSHLTGDKQFDDLIVQGVLHQSGDNDFMVANQTKTLGNEDQSYWALLALSAAENGFTTSKLGNLSWVDFVVNVFDEQVLRWNTESCDGGLNWQIFPFNSGYTYKNSATNGNFFLLASRLAKFTGNSTYSEWAEKAFEWTQDVGLVDENYHVYDGTDETTDCSQINKIQWSNNLAVFVEGAAHLYNITDGDDKWKNAVTGFVNASSVFTNGSSILSEVACESNGKCNVDQRSFKGITARSFARAAQSAPFVADKLTSVLEASAKAAAEGCDGKEEDLKCALRWNKENDAAVGVDSGLGEAFSALAVVQALLVPDAKAPVTGSPSGSNSTGTHTGNGPSPSGSGQPDESEGAADSLLPSRILVGAFAIVALSFL